MDHAGGAWCGADAAELRAGRRRAPPRRRAARRSTPACPATGSTSHYDDDRRGGSTCPGPPPGGWSTSSSCATPTAARSGLRPGQPAPGRRRVRRQVGAASAPTTSSRPGCDLPGARRATWRELTVPAPALGAEVEVRASGRRRAPATGCWSPTTAPSTTSWPTSASTAPRWSAPAGSPPFHLVLLAPGRPQRVVLGQPRLRRGAGRRRAAPAARRAATPPAPVVGMGASLGGAGDAARPAPLPRPRSPGCSCSRAASSGRGYDRHESGFARLPADRPVRRAGAPRVGRRRRAPVPTSLTCGAVEENLANNREMARALLAGRAIRRQLVEVPDAHNFTAWRDAFDPHLTESVWPRVLGRPDGRSSTCEHGSSCTRRPSARPGRWSATATTAGRCWCSRPSRAGPATSPTTAWSTRSPT